MYNHNYALKLNRNTTMCHTHSYMIASSERSIVRLWQVLKQTFMRSTKVCTIHCGIVHRFVHSLYDVWSVELQVQFRHLLPQLGVPQLHTSNQFLLLQ